MGRCLLAVFSMPILWTRVLPICRGIPRSRPVSNVLGSSFIKIDSYNRSEPRHCRPLMGSQQIRRVDIIGGVVGIPLACRRVRRNSAPHRLRSYRCPQASLRDILSSSYCSLGRLPEISSRLKSLPYGGQTGGHQGKQQAGTFWTHIQLRVGGSAFPCYPHHPDKNISTCRLLALLMPTPGKCSGHRCSPGFQKPGFLGDRRSIRPPP